MNTIYRYNILLTFAISIILLLFIGCAERDQSDNTTASGSTSKADEALKKAEKELESAGIAMTFNDPGEILHPENLIPNPGDLASPEKQKHLEEAIRQLNIVISEIEEDIKLAPSILTPMVTSNGSISDRAMVHFYLGVAYIFDAISRLLISDDPEETFIIKYDPKGTDGEWFTFKISEDVQNKLDATIDPLQRPLVFTLKERQAITDAIDLMSNATVKPKLHNIEPQSSTVNRPPYNRYAVWHFKKAVSLFAQYNRDLMETLDEFDGYLNEMELSMQKDSEEWGLSYIGSPY